MAARRMKKTIDMDKGQLVIEIAGKSKTYDTDDLNGIITMRAVLHGISQKLGDSCAGSEPSFTIIDAVWKQISGENGTWSIRKPKEKTVGQDKILQAMIDSGMTREQAEALLAKAI